MGRTVAITVEATRSHLLCGPLAWHTNGGQKLIIAWAKRQRAKLSFTGT